MIVRQVLWIPIVAGLTSFLPPLVFKIFRRIAAEKIAENINTEGSILVTKVEWFMKFPQYQLWEIGLLLTIILCVFAFIFMILFNLVLPFKRVVSEQISDGIYKLD